MRIVLYAVLALAALPAFPLSKGRRLPLRTLYTADRTLAVTDIASADFSPNSYVDSWSDNGMLWIEAEIPADIAPADAEIVCLSTEQLYLADVFVQTGGGWLFAGSAGTSLPAPQKSLDTMIPAVALPPGAMPDGQAAGPRLLRIRLDATHSSLTELHVTSVKDFIRRNSRLHGFFSAVLCAGIAVTALIVFFGALFQNASPAFLAAACLALIADIFMESGIGGGTTYQLFQSSRYIYKSAFFFLCAAALAAQLSVHAQSKADAAPSSPSASKAMLFMPFLIVSTVAVGILYVLLPISDSVMKFIPIFSLAALTAVLTMQCRMQIVRSPQSWHDCIRLLAAFYLIFLERLFHAVRFIPGTTAVLTVFDNDNAIPEITALILVSGTALSQIRRDAARTLAALHDIIRRAEQGREEDGKTLFACTELSAMLVNSMQTLCSIAELPAGNAPPEQSLVLKNGIRRAKQLTTAIALLSNGRIGADALQTDAEPLNLHDFLLQSIRQELADLKLNNCFIDIHEQYPSGECVSADKRRLSLILSFLMQAAARQSRPGSTVMISAEYTDYTFVYTVHFHAAPFSVDEICQLLELDPSALSKEQEAAPPARRFLCGIELYAAKKITDQLKGTVAISPDSDGNTVSFRIALAPAAGNVVPQDAAEDGCSEADEQNAAPQQQTEAPPAAETVFILEEDYAVRNQLVHLLRPRCKTISLDNGEEFLRLSRHEHSDLVVCSLTLAGKDAFALLADERRDSSVPFIVLAAQPSPKTERELLRLGAADVIEKPFRTDSLLLKINALLALRRAHTESLLQKISASLQTAVRCAAPAASLTAPGHSEKPAERTRGAAPQAHDAAPLTALCISANLTKKETEIAFLIAKKLTDKEIAQALDISPATVAVHNKNIFRKLGIHTRKELLEKAGV